MNNTQKLRLLMDEHGLNKHQLQTYFPRTSIRTIEGWLSDPRFHIPENKLELLTLKLEKNP